MEKSRRQILAVLLILLLMIVAAPFIGIKSNLAVARAEPDAPFVAAETRFVVYPDGRVGVEGALNYTGMVPPYRGPTAQGSFNLTSTQASADLTVNLPPEMANQFPYNSTTADLLVEYSDGLLDQRINSTMVLPPIAQSQYPFNSTDGTEKVTYSDGVLNIEVEGNTTLPRDASQQFPFNATDIIVVGAYSPYTLDGTITFSVLPDIIFDDVDVDFTGNQTDLTLNGTVHVVFGVPLGDLIIHDETELKQKIEEFKRDLVGEKGLVWNVTGGLLNVTKLNISYELNSVGADVTFEMYVHGDFVRALAYVMSGGRNEMLLYPVLSEAYQSVLSGSFDVRYSHVTLVASMRLTFSYDLKRLMDYVLTPPTGTTPYVIASNSMGPTLWMGDVVMVEEVSNPGDIVANPETGDVIAFYHPEDQQTIIIHRAINKIQVDGTWYFQTKRDAYDSPDYWEGDNTLDGMISETILIGKAVRRIPFLGYLLSYSYYSYPYGYYDPYLQSAVAVRMALLKAGFSAVQNMSVQLSYSSVDKRFDFQFAQVDKLKALADEIALILPEILPPETPPELKSFVESLLNTTYASVSTVQASVSYESGTADLKATATIEGDLDAELNYVKDLCFQLLLFVVKLDPPSDMTIPWQAAFINQTNIDVDNFIISAKLDETSFEGRIEGLTLLPPIDAVNATHFRLERFFNLTAPQYSGQQEFPGQNQKLKITIEGGSNITHAVTIYRPPTVPEPDLIEFNGKSMVWFNQTISSLKDLVFKIEPTPTRTLTVTTAPIPVEVFVNGTSWGISPQSRVVEIGTYIVTFGDVDGFYVPANQVVTLGEYAETIVEGVYEPEPDVVVEEITEPELVNATNPFIVDATEEAATSLIISGISDPITIVVQDVTEPEDVDPPPGTLEVLGNYVLITVNNTDITVNATIRIYYTLEQLAASGLDESTLEIRFWNATSDEWEPVVSHVNTEERYVWAIIDHLSLFAILGRPGEGLLSTQLFLAIVCVMVIAVTLVSAIYIRRRKRAITHSNQKP